MKNLKSIRAFIGAKDFNESSAFYKAIGFNEKQLSGKMSYFEQEGLGFYLQDYYIKDWINNSMLFIEVADLEGQLEYIKISKPNGAIS